jgi:cytochrome c
MTQRGELMTMAKVRLKAKKCERRESEDFAAVARRLECHEDKGRFEARLKKIARGTAETLLIIASVFLLCPGVGFAEEGNTGRGQQIFRVCSACHSLQPGKSMTGPSLSGIWNKKAGSDQNFSRYSDALKSANVVWDDNTLDAWVTNPQLVVPGNEMTFPGVKEPQQRLDLLAFLKQATKPGASVAQDSRGGMGGMGGMMGGGQVPNLKKLDDEDRVQSVGYCRDTYVVATADGKKRKFWERNLRLKTDSSAEGPMPDAPALVGAGMMGDRADIIFSSPDEIGKFVKPQC